MNPSDKPLNPFEPSRIDPVDSTNIEWENQGASVLNCQIIVAALCMGMLTFAGVSLYQSGFQVKLMATATTLIGVIAAAGAIVMSFVFPPLVSGLSTSRLSSSQEPNSEIARQLLAVYQTQLILGCAFLEGAGFLNVYLYKMFESIFPLVAFAICLALLVARIPTKAKIQRWMAKRLQH